MKADAAMFLEWLATKEDMPYRWGGRGETYWTPAGFQPSAYESYDCWGLVAAGLLAAGGPDLRGWNTDRAWAELPTVATPSPGCVAFWAPQHPRHANDVEHVEVVLGPSLDGRGFRTYGASGGGHLTTSLAMAESQGARVKYRKSHLDRLRFAGFRALPLTHAV